jgi:CRP-like cAMP-binding protein
MRDQEIAKTINLYKTYPLFSGAQQGFYEILTLYSKNLDLKRGELIMNYGETVDKLYLILEGAVKVYMRDKPSKQNTLKNIKEIKKDIRHPMRRTIATSLPKDYEVGIKKAGDTFLEPYFIKKPHRQISRCKIVVSSFKLKMMYIPFADL